jgi:4-hydroxy-tetrahydrodipicolinate synthase
MIQGSMTAIVTPFKNGRVDERALKKLVEFQIKKGIHGLVPCGTTGESATLTHEEHHKVVEIVIKAAKKAVPVIAGTGSNSTDEAISLTRHAKKSGADAALLITPYYNRPTQEGLYQHFKKVAKAVDIPLILYNVPSRTGVNMAPETVGRLSKIENIIGLKDAAGNLRQTAATIQASIKGFKVFTGDDHIYLPLLSIGGAGGICVMANIAPRETAQLYQAFKQKDWNRAKKLHYNLQILNEVLYLETNPIPVKWAVHRLGLISDEIRLPLTPLDKKFRPRVEAAMRKFGLIK